MNPNYTDIFGRLDWLTKKVKYLWGGSSTSYKVFTALVSQSGTGNAGIDINTGSLTVGVTYYILNDSPGMDFTNVGATTNTPGNFFLATGTTPNSWGSDEGGGNSILAYYPAAPVVTVLENTLGKVYFEYVGPGVYRLGSNEGLFNNPVVITSLSSEGNYDQALQWLAENPNSIRLYTGVAGTGDSDNILGYPATVEVRVYN